MQDEKGAAAQPADGATATGWDDFELRKPAIVCRWRLASSTLPLANRHLRALSVRDAGGGRVSTHLIAWAKQHIEWTLAEGTADEPNGVLLLVVDEKGRAAMSCGPYEPLPELTAGALARRARGSSSEAEKTGVAPEALWLVRDGALVAGIDEGWHASGASGLVSDLASTLGLPVSREDGLADRVASGAVAYDEAFLVSDEHGVVGASDASGEVTAKLAGAYRTLLERAGK